MQPGVIGLATGMALGFAGVFGGFGAFVLVLVLGLAGLTVGLIVERRPDLAGFLMTGAHPRH